MTEILITSSVLILALLVLRRVFREKISRRAQYALWLLVLARLLIPVSLPTAGFGVLSAAEPAVEAASSRLESRAVYVLPLDRAPAAEVPAASQTQPGQVVETGDSFGYPVLSSDGETVTRYARQLTASELLRYLWYGGMALTGLWFLAGNLRFRWKLRRRRRPYPVEGCPVPVYLAEGWLASPCLVGLLRPAIYLTPAAAATEERQRHVIAHELTHRRHLDPLWSLLRSVCLVVYWFDPLVWAAALASRTDGELACDEAVLAGLGQEERLAYGRSLLALVPVRRTGGDPFLTATTMAAGKRQLKDRIGRIAQARRTTALALTLALVLAAVTCAATFTAPAGAEDDGSGTAPLTGSDDPLTGAELTYFAEEWFNGDDFNIRNQFLNSLYDRPEDIDLSGEEQPGQHGRGAHPVRGPDGGGDESGGAGGLLLPGGIRRLVPRPRGHQLLPTGGHHRWAAAGGSDPSVLQGDIPPRPGGLGLRDPPGPGGRELLVCLQPAL